MHEKTGWFMNILDKEDICDTKFCPPHYIPHKLPIGKKVTTERCHVHKAKWRMAHHTFYCQVLKCPHFKFMKKKHEEMKRKKEI